MPETLYLIFALAIGFAVTTLLLRALPFVLLRRLRKSAFVRSLAVWMPVGILLILVVTTFHSTVSVAPAALWYGLMALAVTIAVHLILGRRTILSVGAGTLVFVLLVNLL
ncbi:branched-chain amino acid transporter AzlD [Microlunatus elymi]|uniref:Branched-chain amino acid transporter AzlD n=1 Tax=Microlunatus elymi TaxID=2596828 RepID=A0A516Q3B1_9ACTN|nr:AzlD domain-containing protein [Microlunatus elymi]QDP97898.1 branched-chain amino acid transporter AzlD [Microlunatus elymi]